jgi:hypothetical protein
MTANRRRLGIALLAVVAALLFWLAPEPDFVEPTDGVAAGPATTNSDLLGLRLPALRSWPTRVPSDRLPELAHEPTPADVLLAQAAATDQNAGRAAAIETAAKPLPALPYRYIGRLSADGSGRVFLTDGRETVSAEVGDALGGGWRLDAVRTDRLEFSHLPTDTHQSLNTASP